MDKVRIQTSSKIEKELDIAFKKAMNDESFKTLVKKLKISDDLARKNVTKLEDTLSELENCKKCRGLYECKNKVSGHVLFPEVDEDKLKFNYTPCKYEKKRMKDLEEKETNRSDVKNARMKDIDITDKNRIELIKKVKTFYDNYDPSKNMKGLFIHGSFGSGKTFIVSSLFNELNIKKNASTETIYFPELLRTLRDNFDLLESNIGYLQRVDLLLIDDIGAENVTPWGRDEILGAILQYRMNEALPTFFTSNLNIKELEKHLSTSKNSEDIVKARRIIERIKQLTEDVELVSVNRRK